MSFVTTPNAPSPELMEWQSSVHQAYAIMMPGYTAMEEIIDGFFQAGLHFYMEWTKIVYGNSTLTLPIDDEAY